MMFNRKIRSTLPVVPNKLDTFYSHETVLEKEHKRKKNQEIQYNKRHRSKNLSPLKPGDKVWIIDLRVYGKIIEVDKLPNSYWIQTSKSNVRRNRWHLIPAPYFNDNNETMIHALTPPLINKHDINKENINLCNENVSCEKDVCMNDDRRAVIGNQNETDNQTVPTIRPVRNRKPPNYLKDYVT